MIRKFIAHWGPALAVMAVIFWASDTPGVSLPRFGSWDTLFKKGGHALGYALLGAAFVHGLHNERPGRPALRTLALAVALAAAYAVTDEAHQALTPSRNPSIQDVVIDTAGAAAGVWMMGRRSRP